MSGAYEADDFMAEWEKIEADWEERVNERVETLEWRAMLIALVGKLNDAKVEMQSAETALCVAIARANKAREMCLSIAGCIEAVSKMVRQ